MASRSRSPYPSTSPSPTLLPSRPDSGDKMVSPASADTGRTASPRVTFATTVPSKQTGRIPSPPPPPPPPIYDSRVSFDLFSHSPINPSFSLVFQRKEYAREKRSRTYLCGTDESDYSAYALEYIIENLVDDGDDIVCIRVVDDKETDLTKEMIARHTEYRTKAQSVQKRVQDMLDANKGPAVKIVIELAVGKIGPTIDRMVAVHHPDSIVVGTRGKSMTESNFGKSSVSEYLYQNSPVPVVIVRPAKTRRKNLQRRQEKPERRKYIHLFDDKATHSDEPSPFGKVPEASEYEREAVAKAIGLPDSVDRLEAYLEQSRGRAASREPRLMSEDTSGESSDEEDEDEGIALPRTSAGGRTLHVRWAGLKDEEEEAEPRGRFEDMPNYVPELAEEDEVRDVTPTKASTNLGKDEEVAHESGEKS